MSLLTEFRYWFNRPSILGFLNQSSEGAYYNQPLFEMQVTKAARYRQAQVQPLLPTHHLQQILSASPSHRLSQDVVRDTGGGALASASLVGEMTSASQRGEAFAPLSIMASESGATVVNLFLDQARGYVHQKLWDKAIAACEKAIALDPQRGEAHRLMGKTLHAMGKPFDSMGYYADALALQPQSAEIYTDLGDLYSYSQEWEQAARYYQKAVELASESSTLAPSTVLTAAQKGLISAQSQLRRQAGQRTQKVDEIYHSLSLSPETFTAEEHCEMGHWLVQQGDREAAAECFHRAIDGQPTCVEAHLQLGLLLEQRQQWKEAIFHYKQAVRNVQNNPESLTSLEPEETDENTLAVVEDRVFEPDLFEDTEPRVPAIISSPERAQGLPQSTSSVDRNLASDRHSSGTGQTKATSQPTQRSHRSAKRASRFGTQPLVI